MKGITIQIVVDENSGKIATAMKTDGYSSESVCDQLELLGLMENTKNVINNKIKVLMDKVVK